MITGVNTDHDALGYARAINNSRAVQGLLVDWRTAFSWVLSPVWVLFGNWLVCRKACSASGRFFRRGAECADHIDSGYFGRQLYEHQCLHRRGGHVASGHAPLVIIMTCFNCLGYIVGAVFLVATCVAVRR